MIIVEAHMHALGGSRGESLCRVEIVNKTGGGAKADYEVKLFSRSNEVNGRGSRLIRTAVLKDYPRTKLPAWRLIQAAMEALG